MIRPGVGHRVWDAALPSLGTALCIPWLGAGCGAANTPRPLRPEPAAYADTLPISEPRNRQLTEATRLLDAPAVGEFSRLLSIRRWIGPAREAVNLTRLDDVVSSAWFEHRNGHRRLTPEEVARGPTTGGPDVSGMLTIVDAKTEGRSPGFTVRDARGERYLFKFDPLGFLHLTSAADVISSRLLYAAGYHTPENYIVVFDGAQLVLDPEARITLTEGRGQRSRPVDAVRFLSPLDRLPDGRFLAMASKILPGILKGPFRFKGRRSDDPNDYYYHQHRRELRGLYVLAAWLNYVDVHFTNTLDAYVEPGYLRHYLIDFGETLGSGTVRPQEPRAGREHNFDLMPTLGRLLSLGFYRMPWETSARRLIHPSIGWLPVEGYRPGGWKPRLPNAAFSRITPRDGYWGAKLVAAFTDAQIRAAVVEGRLSDAFAADTLAKILAFRRDRTVAYWYSQVTPIENAHVGRDRPSETGLVVSFDDLGIRDRVWNAAVTAYRWEFEHRALGIHWRGEAAAIASARQTVVVASGGEPVTPPPRPGGLSREEAIATLNVMALRDGATGRPARIYLAWDADGRTYEVVGLEH